MRLSVEVYIDRRRDIPGMVCFVLILLNLTRGNAQQFRQADLSLLLLLFWQRPQVLHRLRREGRYATS